MPNLWHALVTRKLWLQTSSGAKEEEKEEADRQWH